MSGLSQYPPTPSTFRDWKEWATQLTNYLSQQTANNRPTDPQPVQLAHKLGNEKAITDGLLMFDPALGKVVCAVGGVWKEIEFTP